MSLQQKNLMGQKGLIYLFPNFATEKNDFYEYVKFEVLLF